MTMLHIAIMRKGDPPPLEGADLAQWHSTVVDTAMVLEGGMRSGAPSVAFTMPLPDGKFVFAETTLALLIMFMSAARGAFPEAFVGSVFEEHA